VLAAKYDLGLVKERFTRIEWLDRTVAGKDSVELSREIAEHAITLVRNDDQLLPLSSLNPEAKIFNLAITNGDDRLWISNMFAGAMCGAGCKIQTLVLDERSSDAEVQKALGHAKSADVVIASLYGRVRTGQERSVSLPEPGAKALDALIADKKPIVAISFGNPYLLQSFPGLRTYLVAYGDMPSLQQAAALAITGKIDITGKLPISLPGLYVRGTGIQLKAIK
jgi:beta-N-acetylhexosaminidase